MKKKLNMAITILIIIITILIHNNFLYAANMSLRESIMNEDEVVLYFFGYFSGAPKVSYEQKMIKYGSTNKNWFTGKEKPYSIDDIVSEIEPPIAKDSDYEINFYNYTNQNISDVKRLQSKIAQLMDDEKFAEEWSSIKDTNEGMLYTGLYNACSAIIQEYNRLDGIYKDVEQDDSDPAKEPAVFLSVRAWVSIKSGCTTLSLENEEVSNDAIEEAVKNKNKGITQDRKEELLNQVDENMEKIQNCEDNGYAQFSHNKEVLISQLEAVRNGIDGLTQSQMSTENGTQEETDQQEELEKETTISGTVIMGSTDDPYTDGDLDDPRNTPDSYKPEGVSEDAERLKEIGSIIIASLRVVGVVVAVVTLIALGFKYMAGSVSEKAEYKKTMIPYLIGAFILLVGTQIVGILYDLVMNVEK